MANKKKAEAGKQIKQIDVQFENEIHLNQFPCLLGSQGKEGRYVALIPLIHLPSIFSRVDEDLPVEERNQRCPNKRRISKIKEYILENREGDLAWAFSALFASMPTSAKYEEITPGVGYLTVPDRAGIEVLDGQHRLAGLIAAVQADRTLGDETIVVELILGGSKERKQQIIADFNKKQQNMSTALTTMYDRRDLTSEVARTLYCKHPVFYQIASPEERRGENRNLTLFPISALSWATERTQKDVVKANPDRWESNEEELKKRIAMFFGFAAERIQVWREISDETDPEKRKELVETTVSLEVAGTVFFVKTLAFVGEALILETQDSERWQEEMKHVLDRFASVNLGQENPEFQKRCVDDQGKIVWKISSQQAYARFLKLQLGIALTPAEQEEEGITPEASEGEESAPEVKPEEAPEF